MSMYNHATDLYRTSMFHPNAYAAAAAHGQLGAAAAGSVPLKQLITRGLLVQLKQPVHGLPPAAHG